MVSGSGKRGLLLFRRFGSWGPVQQLLNLACLYLLFPFTPRVSGPVICAVAASSWVFFRLPRTRASRIAAYLLAVGGLLWAVFGVYVAFPGVKYSYKARSNVPWDAGVYPLVVGSDVVGQLLYLTDPVRASSSLRKILTRLGDTVEFLDDTSQITPQTLAIPLSSAIRREVLGTDKQLHGDELIVPYAGMSLGVALTYSSCPGEDCSIQVEVPLTASAFSLVDYVRSVSNPSDVPWAAVTYSAGTERDAALYGAYLDFALQSFSHGDLGRAFGGMESAAPLAPTSLERSRSFALLGGMSGIILGGSIGETQSLAFFDRAMRTWVATHPARPISRKGLDNPVDLWLFDSFTRVFFRHQTEYPGWKIVLGYHEKPPVQISRVKLPGDALFFEESILCHRLRQNPWSPQSNNAFERPFSVHTVRKML